MSWTTIVSKTPLASRVVTVSPAEMSGVTPAKQSLGAPSWFTLNPVPGAGTANSFPAPVVASSVPPRVTWTSFGVPTLGSTMTVSDPMVTFVLADATPGAASASAETAPTSSAPRRARRSLGGRSAPARLTEDKVESLPIVFPEQRMEPRRSTLSGDLAALPYVNTHTAARAERRSGPLDGAAARPPPAGRRRAGGYRVLGGPPPPPAGPRRAGGYRVLGATRHVERQLGQAARAAAAAVAGRAPAGRGLPAGDEARRRGVRRPARR